ncbi:MAG TPA: peptidylprolyl isomerase [Pseudobdellovibrionaceae bacterium]|nr:peptidylprolyl isomerase [Pseudobdellovibrionaceae bacterium]
MSQQAANVRSSLRELWRTDRRRVTRAIMAWTFFLMIIVVFIFFGVTPDRMGAEHGGWAAQVNGKIISLAEYSQVAEQMRADPQVQMFEQSNPEFARAYAQQQALTQLIRRQVMIEDFKKNRVFVPDREVAEVLVKIPAFQENGQFSRTRYLQYIEGSGQTKGGFEDRLREQQQVERAARAFAAALRPLAIEDDRLKKVESQSVNVDVVSFPLEIVAPETVPAAAVRDFLAKPESAARVKSYYETNKAKYLTPEQAKVRHILLAVDEKAAEKDWEATRKKAQDLQAQLKAGADFASLAKKHSADPGSKDAGGLIQFFPRGQMVPEFEDYAFKGKIGEISEPIRTNYGFHIVRVEDRKAEKTTSLEEAREDIAEFLIAQEQSREEIAQLERALAAQDKAAVEAFLSKHKLKFSESGDVSMTANALPKVGGGSEAVSEAFRLSADRPLAKSLIRQGGQAVLLKYRTGIRSVVAAKPTSGKTGKDEALTPEAEKRARELMSYYRGQEAMSDWVEALTKTAKVSVNPAIGQNTAAGRE